MRYFYASGRLGAYIFLGGASSREGLSLAENLGAMGVPLPFKLKQFLHQLNEKGDEKDADTGASKEKI